MEIGSLAKLQVREQVKALAKTVDLLEEHERNRAEIDARYRNLYPGGDYTPRLSRLLGAIERSPLVGDLNKNCPIELDQSQRIARLLGREPAPGTLFWPMSRDLTAAVAAQGGYLVDSRVRLGDFSGAARAADILSPLGATYLQETANGQFVRMNGDVTVSYLPTEGTAGTESTPQFVQGATTPKHAFAYVEISRTALASISTAQEAWIMAQMGAAIGASRATKALQGTGAAGEPQGLLNTSSLTSASGAALTWNIVTQTMADVATANAVINQNALGWALGPSAELVMRRREKAAGSGFILSGGAIDGQRALTSNAAPNTTAIYADWSQLVIVEYSAIEVGVDKYGAAANDIFKTGRIGVRCIYSYDVLAARPASFSAITGIT